MCPTHELHSKCTTRQAHTHGKPRPPEPTKARARSPAQQVHHTSGTHTHRAYETALPTKLAHIRYALTSYFSGCCHTPPRSSASCGSLALQPSYPLVNAVLRDTLPRTGLLFAHKTQRTHPGGEGDGGGRTKTARQCTTRQAHTHTAISALPTHKARAMLTCTAVHHASGTHTHRQGLRNGPTY